MHHFHKYPDDVEFWEEVFITHILVYTDTWSCYCVKIEANSFRDVWTPVVCFAQLADVTYYRKGLASELLLLDQEGFWELKNKPFFH